MTIASAFNDIAVAQGGTAAKSGAITAAIDALNDALAGSDQPQAKTIEQAVRLLGEHIGGGGGGGTHKVYLVQQSQGSTLSSLDLSVKDWNNQAVSVYETEIEGPEGPMTVGCFDSTDGVQYQIERTLNPYITGADCITYSGGSSINYTYDTGIVFYTGAASDVIMFLEL
ncbi:MAG: hypothetical protein IKG22_05600 [Atopobiaceae bacterium]|nr:hypothetical protein [Atopobiaceae bacterium]